MRKNLVGESLLGHKAGGWIYMLTCLAEVPRCHRRSAGIGCGAGNIGGMPASAVEPETSAECWHRLRGRNNRLDAGWIFGVSAASRRCNYRCLKSSVLFVVGHFRWAKYLSITLVLASTDLIMEKVL